MKGDWGRLWQQAEYVNRDSNEVWAEQMVLVPLRTPALPWLLQCLPLQSSLLFRALRNCIISF